MAPQEVFAMHVMEGFLPFLAAGLVRLRQIVQEESNRKVLLALCGALFLSF